MALVDAFSSEKVVDGRIVLEPYEIIPSTQLDDDPTEVESGEIIVPGGDAELVFLINAAVTLSPTSVTYQFLISYDGTNFFVYDGLAEDDWSEISVVTANMPDARAVIKGRIVAPFVKLKILGVGTDATNYFTVDASITRVPQAVQV
jgi:hypothetical protein